MDKEGGFLNIPRRYESDEELNYEELAASCKELYTISEKVIAQLLAENNKLVSAKYDLQNEVTLKVGKTQKGGVELCFQKRFLSYETTIVLRIQSLIEFRV